MPSHEQHIRAVARPALLLAVVVFAGLLVSVSLPTSEAQQSTPYTQPRWMAKLLALQAGQNGATSSSIKVGANVDVSNEPGPQSETFVAVFPPSGRTARCMLPGSISRICDCASTAHSTAA